MTYSEYRATAGPCMIGPMGEAAFLMFDSWPNRLAFWRDVCRVPVAPQKRDFVIMALKAGYS